MTLRDIALVLMISISLSACGFSESSYNPVNWFGDDAAEPETVENVALVQSSDPRPLIPEISSLVLEETPGGVIVRATGLPPTQGWFGADLVSMNEGEPENGVLTYEFRAIPPRGDAIASTVQSREVIAARYVDELRLRDIREIRVVGETNTRSARP